MYSIIQSNRLNLANPNQYTRHALALISACFYLFISYYLHRSEGFWLLSSYALLFVAYVYLVKTAKQDHVLFYVVLALFFRLLLLFAFPTLSDDIYRFVWDGKLLSLGIHPFNEVPSAIVAKGNLPKGLSLELYQNLNSPDYFTIYPPFAQLIFWLSSALSPSSVLGAAVVMRLLIVSVEMVSIRYLLKLADHYQIKPQNVLWYALNPLVILELTGNLHYEAFMICFLLIALYLLVREKYIWAGFFVAMAVSVKLLPLILLPLFLRKIDFKHLVRFYGSTAFFIVLTFLPMFSSSLIHGMESSLSLYFQKFEFNASVYYLIREFGYAVKGYNIIQSAGPYLAVTTFILILLFALFAYRQKIPQAIIGALMIYFLMATTVHPWYVTTILAFSVLTNFRFGVVWTCLIFFTYLGYDTAGFQENLWVTTTEYVLLTGYITYEFFKNYQRKQGLESI